MAQQILVTGGNSGIGLEMVKAFAAQGHTVVVAARTQSKTEQALADIRRSYPNATLHAVALDLSNFAGVDAAATQILALLPQLDTVLLNAGSYATQLRRDANGLEEMVGSMHFGHFRLMQQLLPRLQQAPAARVVVTASVAHWLGVINAKCMQNPAAYRSATIAYGSAKLANLIYARELARRVAGSNIRVNAFHPGGVATGIWRELPSAAQAVIDKVMITPKKGADTAIWLATAPEAAAYHGDYFVRRRKQPTRAIAHNRRVAQDLWALSERIAGL